MNTVWQRPPTCQPCQLASPTDVTISWHTNGTTSPLSCNGTCPLGYHTIDSLGDNAIVSTSLDGTRLACARCINTDGHTCGGSCSVGYYMPTTGHCAPCLQVRSAPLSLAIA